MPSENHAPSSPAPATHAAPSWLFGLLVMPFGITVGYVTYAMPHYLRGKGFDLGEIGAISAMVSIPHSIKVGWAPALDAGWRRRNWFLGCVLLAGLCLALTQLVPPDKNTQVMGFMTSMSLYTLVLFLAQFGAATSSAAVDGLMAITLPPERKDNAAGWAMAGNLGGTGLGGWLAQALATAWPDWGVAIFLGSCCILFGVPALFLKEPEPIKKPILRTLLKIAFISLMAAVAFASETFGTLLGVDIPSWLCVLAALSGVAVLLMDLWPVIKTRAGWTGLLICMSPVGTGAMTNLFTAVGTDFGATETDLSFVQGLVGGAISAGGCLLGGYLCTKMNRKLLYCICGFLTTLFALGLGFGPAERGSFIFFTLGYSFVNGICYGSFAAFVLEIIGHSAEATTSFALFVSASNAAINYVTALDGKAYEWAKNGFTVGTTELWGAGHEGRVGLALMDAGTSYVGLAVLAVVILVIGKNRGETPPAAAAA